MNHLNRSRNLAAPPRAGCVPVLFLLAGWLVLVPPLRADNRPTYLFQIDTSAVPGGFYPSAVALDSSNNVYVADFSNNRVEKFTSSGNYLTQWGGSGSGNGQFIGAAGVAVDSSNNVYVVDYGNGRVQKFDSNGNYLTQWGSSGSGNSQFAYPHGIAVDRSNNVYVTDDGNNRVEKFTSSGNYLTQWGGSGSGNGQFHGAQGVAVDSSNNVYVADFSNNRVEKFTSSGNYLTQWGNFGTGNGQFFHPYDIAVDRSNNVYVADLSNNRVEKFTSSGNYLSQWGSSGGGAGQFSAPVGVAVDRRGNFVYVADAGNARIQVFVNLGPPIITNQRASQTVPAGINVSFGVGLLGTAPFAYQWISNNVAVPGATNATFTLTNVCLSDSGAYSVLVTNNFGSELSCNAVLTVSPALVTTQPGGGISATSAVLSGLVTVGPVETVVWFEWGTDTNYGNIAGVTVVPAEANAAVVSSAVSGLSLNYLYHYRLVAANDYGLAYGADQQFGVAQMVSNTNDGGPGSLRKTIEMAGAGSSVTFLVTGTITLTSGELLITNDLTIIGPGAVNLAISGNHTNRVFEIGPNAIVSISGLTIRDGHAADGYYGANGDGIYNQGTLSLSGCALTDSSAGNGGYGGVWQDTGGNGGHGGGIYNANTLQATACTFSGNEAGFGGAGFDGNPAGMGRDGGDGGGIYNLGTMTLTNCTLGVNKSGSGGVGGRGDLGGRGRGGDGGDGGGIFNSGAFALVACTLSANSAGSDGYNAGYPGSGGGIFNAATQPSAELLDTLVASNRPGFGQTSSLDLAGPFTSLGYNLIGQTNGCTGFTNGVHADLAGTTASPLDPQLGPLANNGGPTLTMALLHGSPALDAGDDALLGPPYHLTTDQRGFPRNTGAHVDIGAFQFQPIAAPPVLITLPGSAASGFQLAFTNTSGATFSVLTATNLGLPSSNWTVLGQALELTTGQFQFTDPQTTNAPQRFYRVSSP
jgi:DNA-binding beta-propeller fold protein YncE